MLESVLQISHIALPVLALLILAFCLSALFKRRNPLPGKAKLVNAINGDSFPLTTRETSVGRHKHCDIILNYPTVSRYHAVIICAKDGWYIVPLRSESGVFVNGKTVEKKELLKTGDKVSLGEIDLIFDNK